MALTTNSNHTVLRGNGGAGRYTGIAPIVVNNNEMKISANIPELDVESPLYFSENTTARQVISFSGDSQEYSAGDNIDITNHVISGRDWTPELNEKLDISAYEQGDTAFYSAGDNINITNHVVSGKDWNAEINNASSYAYNEAIARIHDTEYSAGANIDITNHYISGKDWTNEINSASANAVEEAKIQITAVDFATAANYALSSDSATYDSNGNIITATYLTAHQDLSDYVNYSSIGGNNNIITSINGSAFSAESVAQSSYNVVASSNINVTTSTEGQNKIKFTVSGKNWADDITAASSYAYNEATAHMPAGGDFIPYSNITTGISGTEIYNIDSGRGIRATGNSGWVEIVGCCKENQNEAHLNLGQNYSDNHAFWMELDGADGGYIQMHWCTGQIVPNDHDSYASNSTATLQIGKKSIYCRLNGSVGYTLSTSGCSFFDYSRSNYYYGGSFNRFGLSFYNESADYNVDITKDGLQFSDYHTIHITAFTTADMLNSTSCYDTVYNNSANWGGKTYTGIGPIVVNNTEDKISADCIELSAGQGIDSASLSVGIIACEGAPYTLEYSSPSTSYSGTNGLKIVENVVQQVGTYRRLYSGSRIVGELVPSGYNSNQYLTTNNNGALQWSDIPGEKTVECIALTTSVSSFDLSALPDNILRVTITTPYAYDTEGGHDLYPIYVDGVYKTSVVSGGYKTILKQTNENGESRWFEEKSGSYSILY